MLVGERKINLFRYFNYLAGMRPEKDDTLPKRLFEPMPDGPSKGHSSSAATSGITAKKSIMG